MSTNLNDQKQQQQYQIPHHHLLTPVDLTKRQYSTATYNNSHSKILLTNEDLLETRVRSIQEKLNSGSSKNQTPIRSSLKPKELNNSKRATSLSKESGLGPENFSLTQQFRTQEKN